MSLRRLTLVLLLTVVAVAVLPSCFDSSSNQGGGGDSGLGMMIPTDGSEPADATTADASPGGGPGDAAMAEAAADGESGDAAPADAAPDASPPVIASFTATPNVIPAGGTRMVTLSWSVTGASSLSISGIGAVTGTSTVTSVSSATTFTLTAAGASGAVATANAAVTTAPALYIDVTNGHDGAPGDGTAAHPYQTVGKAGSVATNGQTIYALAGSYPLQNAAVNIADGVGVEAVSAGTVTFAAASGTSPGLTFVGSGFVHGIAMDNAFINVSAGTVKLDGVQFANIADSGSSNASGINVSATGHAIVTPGGLASYLGAAVSSFAYLSGSGQLEVHGGALNGAGPNAFDGSALIGVTGTSQLLLDGVTIDSARTSAIVTGGNPQVTLQNGTLIRASAGTGGSAWSFNVNNGAPTVVIDHSTITASPSVGIYVNGGSTPSLTLRNGAVVEKSAQQGIYFQGGPGSSGTLTLDNARISDSGSSGVSLGDSAYTVTMRGTQIINNTGDGFGASLEAASVVDLGSGSTAGGNTFSGNAAASTVEANVDLTADLSTADLKVNAIGNTWDPTANGADSAGLFPAGTTLSAPPTLSGKNVRLTQGGASTYFLKLIAAP
jgi:hypothetical protein